MPTINFASLVGIVPHTHFSVLHFFMESIDACLAWVYVERNFGFLTTKQKNVVHMHTLHVHYFGAEDFAFLCHIL